MKHIKKFETIAAFETARATLDLPNVSLIEATMGVNYLPYDPTLGHDYIEIGGIKWATMNLGANNITDVGLYYQWGDTQGYTSAQIGIDKTFDDYNYKYYDNNSCTKYNSTDGLTTLQPMDDAVTFAWGGNWRIPTTSEWESLGQSVNYEYTSDYQGSGISGLICTDKIDNTKLLFFPYGGIASRNSLTNYASCYWSSSIYTDNIERARNMKFNDRFPLWRDYDSRSCGFNIRGILDDSNS